MFPCDACGEQGNHLCGPKADRAQNFFERVLVHTKGRSAGKPFILDAWQRDEIIRPLFGSVRWDDFQLRYVRAFTLAWVELARKNGKSELLSGVALYGLCADGEESAEVYSVAVDRDQASLVFDTAKRMVELSPILSAELEVVASRKRILHRPTNSVYTVLPGDAAGALGTNPSLVLFDEVLTQRDRHLWDAMRQGFGARSQPMMLAATTASYTSAAFCLEEHNYGVRISERRKAIREGLTAEPDIDPARFVFLRNTPKEADWTDEANWYHANPALGSFLNIESLRNEAREAMENPAAQNAFRVFRLNQWVSQASRWLDMTLWDENGLKGGPVIPALMRGRKCYAGLDLASVSDLTALVLLFPGTPMDADAPGYTVLCRFWLPRAAVNRRKEMREKLERWEREGLLQVTEGQTTDYAFIENQLRQDMESFHVVSMGFDPWNGPPLVQRLEADGLLAVKVPQSAARLNEPCKALDVALARRQLAHGGDEILRWNADNVEAEFTPEGYMKPSKRNSAEKIDGIAALVNAFYVSAIPTEEDASVSFFSFS